MSPVDNRLNKIDLGALASWMAQQGLGRGRIEQPRLLAGGTQNLIVQFSLQQRPFVLRKAAASAYANGSETMRREARVLAALASTDVPHAHLIAACAEEDVLGGAFYLMEPVDGFNVSVGMPKLHGSDPRLRRRMGFALVDGLAALRRVDYRAVGLEDFGRPDGFLERQVSRWRSQLESYQHYPGWPGSANLPEVDAIGTWLDRQRPQTFKPGILHGDYHIKNVLYRNTAAGLAAIIDWELATIGDPMIDLGWLLATWRDADGAAGGTPIVIEPWQGFPSATELVSYYAQCTGEDVSNARWYGVFACFKLALLLEGTYARACAGNVDSGVGREFHARAVALLRRAREWIV